MQTLLKSSKLIYTLVLNNCGFALPLRLKLIQSTIKSVESKLNKYFILGIY